MDIQTISSLISSVGFPIFCCIALFVTQYKYEEKHEQEINALTSALIEINKNLAILSKQNLE